MAKLSCVSKGDNGIISGCLTLKITILRSLSVLSAHPAVISKLLWSTKVVQILHIFYSVCSLLVPCKVANCKHVAMYVGNKKLLFNPIIIRRMFFIATYHMYPPPTHTCICAMPHPQSHTFPIAAAHHEIPGYAQSCCHGNHLPGALHSRTGQFHLERYILEKLWKR